MTAQGHSPAELPPEAAEAATAAAPLLRTRLRPVEPEDHAAVVALWRRHGMPVRSREGWDWALVHNPARLAVGADAGWVLTRGDDIVGFLGNLPVCARHDGLPVWGATCTSFAVDEAYRGHASRLVRAFAAQPGAAFVYVATGSAWTAPMLRNLQFRAVDDPDANRRLRWVASESAALSCLLRRQHLSLLSPLGGWAGWLAAAARRVHDRWRAPTTAEGIVVERISDDQLMLARASDWPRHWNAWARMLSERPGLWVDRSAATMAWRLSDPDLIEDLALWAARDAQGRMLGMCMARKLPDSPGSTPKAELMDWALLPSAPPQTAELLLRQVLRWARSWRLAFVDAKRWTGAAAGQLAGLQPFQVRPLPSDGVWLMTHRTPGAPQMPDWPSWSMTGGDSDDWFGTHLAEPRPSRRPWAASRHPWTATRQASAPWATPHGSGDVVGDRQPPRRTTV